MKKKRIIAMILAGGQGSRLKDLTERIAKPAVSFGGKYRIIDFTLTNCSHSGIDTVGILTQYEPHVLNNHIGRGSPWDLDRMDGGVTVLQPHTKKNDENGWYKGTANAIYRNINFIEEYDPEYVLILSGDHIYKMDYDKMLKYHIQKEADATIGVFEVPLSDAPSFGIMNTYEDMTIYEFEEKPKEPKSTLASMGIYIFKWKVLKSYLEKDEKDKKSSNDFGKNIIPNMLHDGKKLVAYPFEGYWRDVGTIQSFWDAHMDLLQEDNELDLFDKSWRINTRQGIYTPSYVTPEAKIQNTLLDKGCLVEGEVKHSVIFSGVKIGKNSKVIDSIIMADTEIGDNVIIQKAIVANDVKVLDNTVIGDGKDIVVIGEKRVVKSEPVK
ncbi:glucose-1-phosphate adenylyltransferase [Fusobacterium necrophorum subsp. funduliforme]|uniref:Glucose-1-phosphate adenylyltransferase n=5 Tax=Fusobacterium necrophorum TaxID=859 RepID=A0A162J9H8_9FUSO|nr:glucose-1-phosphate adenylyltransferase [Fusobacterium necrophorum]AVQ21237.1 glucose-1-phosphate adenylyltransferase [Fusobacterium necrophorum subsp. funduliforme]AYV92932.1 glucose-1-phosphate adenylyltransferase [Fusobacterium necrophorum subsp. funduliforme]AYZ74252.1 glucose-1-phosphate adenylyltransferase [Fusobacterium necrophorum]AZW09866.1 glucose-1-phosphate adenylyltransferase [Fusobacterium necrophorum subsp. necrophorum]EIJ68924.1 glucose-1-phosphate adenylyltransferase [Fusob